MSAIAKNFQKKEITAFSIYIILQPLVGNAVKHGVGDAPNGGTVKLSTKELPECYEIEISDNGVGFDTENYNKDEAIHVGIENVRSRLELMCNGTLSLKSSIGNGTTVFSKRKK